MITEDVRWTEPFWAEPENLTISLFQFFEDAVGRDRLAFPPRRPRS